VIYSRGNEVAEMTESVKASIRIGDKLVVFEGPRDFVTEQVTRFTGAVAPGASRQPTADVDSQGRKRRRRPAIGNSPNAGSCGSRILALGADGFFTIQRTISDIRTELATRGWHYPLTTLSGRLQTLVQQRHLRREKVKEGRKKVWQYSNL
jgi:hypothetical protein